MGMSLLLVIADTGTILQEIVKIINLLISLSRIFDVKPWVTRKDYQRVSVSIWNILKRAMRVYSVPSFKGIPLDIDNRIDQKWTIEGEEESVLPKEESCVMHPQLTLSLPFFFLLQSYKEVFHLTDKHVSRHPILHFSLSLYILSLVTFSCSSSYNSNDECLEVKDITTIKDTHCSFLKSPSYGEILKGSSG